MSKAVQSQQQELSTRTRGFAQHLLAAVLIGGGIIHLAVMGEHYAEWWLYGAFFMTLSPLQLVQAVLVMSKPTRTLLKAVVLLNGAVILTWIISRTVGFPFGPDAGSAEAAGAGDVIATAYEVLAVGLSVWLLRRRERELVHEPADRLVVWSLGVIIALTTTVAAATAVTAG